MKNFICKLGKDGSFPLEEFLSNTNLTMDKVKYYDFVVKPNGVLLLNLYDKNKKQLKIKWKN